MRHLIYYLLEAILIGTFCQKGMSQEPVGICSFEFWKTASPSDVLLAVEGVNVNQPCNEESGDRPIHIALMRSNNYLAIKALIESGASLFAVNNKGETPAILTEKMYDMAQRLLGQVISNESPVTIERERDLLARLLNDFRQWEVQERIEKGLL